MITSGIEPATFRLVARCLDKLFYRVTTDKSGLNDIIHNYFLVKEK
jgi:hypothetical protein